MTVQVQEQPLQHYLVRSIISIKTKLKDLKNDCDTKMKREKQMFSSGQSGGIRRIKQEKQKQTKLIQEFCKFPSRIPHLVIPFVGRQIPLFNRRIFSSLIKITLFSSISHRPCTMQGTWCKSLLIYYHELLQNLFLLFSPYRWENGLRKFNQSSWATNLSEVDALEGV